MSKQLELFPVTKPAAKVEEKTPNNINEYLLNKSKTNPLDKLPAAVVENYNKYDAEDGKNIVVGPGGQIMMESELRKLNEKEVAAKKNFPTQATPEQVGKLAERLERNAQMSGGKGPFTRGIKNWDAIKEVSKNDPAEMKEIKKTLFKHYNEHGSKFMSDDDLKIIKRGKYSEFPKLNIKPITPIAPVPKEPEIPLEIKIKQLADARLKAKQDLWDKEHGQFGLSNLMRPK
jgi:hypothetical protein